MRTRLITLGSAAALALVTGACGKSEPQDQQALAAQPPLPDLPATLPLSTAPATQVVNAPPVSRLPAAAPVRAVRVAAPEDGYAYADQAADFSDVLADAPPDYGFDYPDASPWAWQGYDDSVVIVEPIAAGYRSYYYRPGADYPYYVRDPDYGYGYSDGELAGVYRGTTLVRYADYRSRLDDASRYLARGRGLYQASRRHRRPVIAADWNARAPAYTAYRARWIAARRTEPDWVRYAARHPAPVAHWEQEQKRRRADERRYAQWVAARERTSPPPRVIPVSWERADWARDRTRYASAGVPLQVKATVLRERAQAQRQAAQVAQRRVVAERQHVLQQRREAVLARRSAAQQQVAARQAAARARAVQLRAAHQTQAARAATVKQRQAASIRHEVAARQQASVRKAQATRAAAQKRQLAAQQRRIAASAKAAAASQRRAQAQERAAIVRQRTQAAAAARRQAQVAQRQAKVARAVVTRQRTQVAAQRASAAAAHRAAARVRVAHSRAPH